MEINTENVIRAVASAPDISTRIDEFVDKIPESDEVIRLFAEIDRKALASPANCLVFYTMLNIPSYSDRIQGFTTSGLIDAMEGENPELARLWKTVSQLGSDERSNFLARVSLMLEAVCLAWQDARDSGRASGSISGSSLMLPLCSGEDRSSQILRTESGSWPKGIWSKIEEVLEELDFTREKDRSWKYHIDLDSRGRLVSGANLKAYVKTGAVSLSPLALARMSQNLVTRLSLIQRTVSMYPSDHPSIAPALESFLELLEPFADSEGGMVALTILGGELMVNNVKVKSKTKAVQNFLSHLTERRINSISFHQGLEVEELLSFMELLNRKPAQIRERGGLVEMCRTRGIQSVTVDEFRYALVARDGKLVSETVSGTLDSALEDLVFRELIDRLQRGDSIRDIPPDQLGDALTRILEESSSGSGKYRSMLADFVATLDPTILEEGVLVSRELQRTLAWSSLRKIIDKNIEDLGSGSSDSVLDALDRLNRLACIGAERGKTHTVMHIIDNVHGLLLEGAAPADVVFAGIILLGSVCERLISSGKLSSASETVAMISDCRLLPVSGPAHASALRRGLSEALRRIDTPDAADVILEAFMESDESMYHAAEKITAEVMFRNLGMRLVDLFLERKREVRARAYSVLRRFGTGYLLMFHSRIDEIQRGGLSVRDPETGRFAAQDWYILRNLVALLGDLGSPRSVPILESLCDDADDRIRRIAIVSLMKADEQKAVSYAFNMIGDPAPDVVTVAIDILARAREVDRGLIPAMLRLMHTLPAARKSLMRFFMKVADDSHVRQHFRAAFAHSRGIPFEDEELMHDALAILIKAGRTEEIGSLKTYIDRNSSGTLRRASAPEHILASVSAAVDMIRSSSGEKNSSGG